MLRNLVSSHKRTAGQLLALSVRHNQQEPVLLSKTSMEFAFGDGLALTRRSAGRTYR